MSKLEQKNKRRGGIETRNKILEESADLFSKKGYDSVSMHEIAEAVNIKESSIYNHFNCKAQILDTLFNIFIIQAPLSRPSDEELEKMLEIMQPEEILKNILFHVGNNSSKTLIKIAMIINYEKFRNQKAADVYFKNVVNEPTEYYERLIKKMINKNIVKPVDARLFAEQYNYVSIAVTKEYFMALNGLTDLNSVIRYMVKTVIFFCGLMKNQSSN